VRKLGVPGHEELAMGALASGNTLYLNQAIIRSLSLSEEALNTVIKKEQQELDRRETLYRGSRPYPQLKGKTVILVDDGIATGASMHVAIESLYKHHPQAIIVAVPVAALCTCTAMSKQVDAFICPLKPLDFNAVGLWYQDFSQTSDTEVINLLSKAWN
ncbi:MAG: phosphoribosyltransferase, partial [Legionellales bacterium]